VAAVSVSSPSPEGGLTDALRKVSEALESLKVPFALVGGLAVSSLAQPRLTRDIDLAVAVHSDLEAERHIHALGYPVSSTVEQTARKRLATARLQGPNDVVVDLLFASSGIEDLVVAEAVPLEVLPGLVLPVARVGHLLAMKVLARDDRKRPQDWDDLRALMAEAKEADIRLAREALEEIRRRGFARGRNLMAAWKRALGNR